MTPHSPARLPPAFDLAATQPARRPQPARRRSPSLSRNAPLRPRYLYISYSGLSIANNKESPPCAPSRTARLPRYPLPSGERRTRTSIVRKHRLQLSAALISEKRAALLFLQENYAPAKERVPAPERAFRLDAAIRTRTEWRGSTGRTSRNFSAILPILRSRTPRAPAPSRNNSIEDCEPQSLDGLDRFGFEDSLPSNSRNLTDEAIATGSFPSTRCGSLAHGLLPPVIGRIRIQNAQPQRRRNGRENSRANPRCPLRHP